MSVSRSVLYLVVVDQCRQSQCTYKTAEERTEGLTAIFDAIRYCGQTGVALCGHGEERDTGGLWNVLSPIGRYNPTISEYMEKESVTRFMSPGSQNEIRVIISDAISRRLIGSINIESRPCNAALPIFSIIVDETTDISKKEQVSICL